MPIPKNIKAVLSEANRLGLISLHHPKNYTYDKYESVTRFFIRPLCLSRKPDTIKRLEKLLSLAINLPIPLDGYQLTAKDIPALTLIRNALPNITREHWKLFIDNEPFII